MKKPRRRQRRLTWTGLMLALCGWLLWEWTPARAVWSIAHLSDPARLATLGERGANPRLNKIVHWLHEAERTGASPETVIRWAQRLNGEGPPRAELVRSNLVRNFHIAEEMGLLIGTNLARLRRGAAGGITRGPHAGEPAEIDHIVPFSLAPEAGNELANLELLPRTLNRRKSDQVGELQRRHAEALHAAGMLSDESLRRVRAQSR